MESSESNRNDTANEPAHPLATALARELSVGFHTRRVLLIGVGSGRNVPPLLNAGLSVDVAEDDAERACSAKQRFAAQRQVRVVRVSYGGPLPFAPGFAGALSTHALLHGSPASVAGTVRAVRDRLGPRAPFYVVLGSTADPRFGSGARVDARTWAPLDGSEARVPHVYFDEPDVRALLTGWSIDSLEQVNAAETAGRWAHAEAEAARLVHWFVRARA